MILSGYGIQGTGSGQWKEQGNTVQNFSPRINVGWGGSGTIKVFEKNGIRVNHDGSGNGGFTLGCDMQFSFAGVSNLGGASWIQMDHINRYATVWISEREKSLNTISINWSTDVARDHTQWSLNGGNWNDAGDIIAGDNRSGYFTIFNLDPNITYSIKIRVKRTDSQLWSESGNISITTYDIAKITEATDIIIGQSSNIKITNPSGAAVQASVYKVDGTTVVAEYRTISGNSYTFNFTSIEQNTMFLTCPNSLFIILRYYIKTTQNGIGYLSFVERKFNVDTTLNKPIFTDFSFEDINAATINLTGDNKSFIKGYSNAKVIIPLANGAVAKNKSTITKYRITIGSKQSEVTYSSTADVIGTINNVDLSSIIVTAIDSRGLQTSVTKAAKWVNYTAPVLVKSNAYRENGINPKVFFELESVFSNINFGIKDNIPAVKYRQKSKEASNYSIWINITPKCLIELQKIFNKQDKSNFLCTSTNINTYFDFTTGKEYNIQLQIFDSLSQSEIIDIPLNSGKPCTAKIKNSNGTYSIGINKFPTADIALDIDGKMLLNGQEMLSYEVIDTW